MSEAAGFTPPAASLVRVAAGLVLTSGTLGVDDRWQVVPGGFRAEARQAFANARRQVEAAGGRWQEVVVVRAYLVDWADFADYNAVWDEQFGAACPPARTTVVVGLLPPFRVELEVTAVAPPAP